MDVVVRKGPAILKLLASEDEALLIRGNSLLVLNLLLHILDGVRRLNLEGDGFTCKKKRKEKKIFSVRHCKKLQQTPREQLEIGEASRSVPVSVLTKICILWLASAHTTGQPQQKGRKEKEKKTSAKALLEVVDKLSYCRELLSWRGKVVWAA